MGNLKSHIPHGDHHKNKACLKQHISVEEEFQIEEVFKSFSKGDGRIDYWEFQETFGPLLSAALWKYLQHEEKDNNMNREVTLEEFTQYADSLMGAGMMNNNELILLFMPVDNLLRTVLEAANIEVDESDHAFLDSLVQEITSEGEDLESILSWINVNCPRICRPVKDKIMNIFSNTGRYVNHDKPISSKILSPVQMFFLHHSLPVEPYFTPKPRLSLDVLALEEQGKGIHHHWTRLYWKDEQENCVTKFEESVFGYHGATVTIFQMTNKDIYALVADEEWKEEGHKFGGAYSLLFKFQPVFKRFDHTPPAIYCNFKSDSFAKGLTFGTDLFIEPDMSNVDQIEVWGCQGEKEVLEQLNHKEDVRPRLENYEAPKQKTAPVGDWKQNVDKQLLEMAGKKFSDERK